MAGKNTAVFGIYQNYGAVESAVDALKMAGFRNTDISVLFPENVGTKDFAHTKATKAPEGATTGAGTGAVVGGALGWLVTGRVLRRDEIPTGPLAAYDRLVPLFRLLDRIELPWGLSLWAVARRPA